MFSGTDFQILLRYHKTSNKGKRKVLTILSARLDSRQKMTAIKEKRHHPLNCCRLLSMTTRAISCSHRPMKGNERITRRGMAHISPQVSHDVISPFPLFRLLRSRQASYPGAATSISRIFFGGLNKKYQCQTVSLRPPLPTGILECSQAHIDCPVISSINFINPIYNDKRQE